ncbi:hypothetical protein HMI55_001325 [Coelomomyces lativittatus]|nr:hypothetical protein HMI55_001325 [Coelomomyces lativittatus]
MNPATSSPEQDTVDSNKNNTNIREQKLRFPGDAYTPRWVRHRGREKEGLCELCPTPKWFQLKNSAFWYHKQFVHGISSVSGMPFWQPTEKRWNEHPSGKRLFEGLCPQCQQWIPLISPHKRHPHRWVAWYRHAYKCHDYLKMT